MAKHIFIAYPPEQALKVEVEGAAGDTHAAKLEVEARLRAVGLDPELYRIEYVCSVLRDGK